MMVCFFFFKQKTAYEMRISDWSSDVCSSDLAEGAEQHDRDRDGGNDRGAPVLQEQEHDEEHEHDRLDQRVDHLLDRKADERGRVVREGDLDEIGRASCRARVCQYV